MKEIKYTEHLKLRLMVRKIPFNYPKIIYENPEQKFFDNFEGTKIAVKKLKYNNSMRNVMIAYEEKDKVVNIVTAHPISDEKIINRLISGRWSKYG